MLRMTFHVSLDCPWKPTRTHTEPSFTLTPAHNHSIFCWSPDVMFLRIVIYQRDIPWSWRHAKVFYMREIILLLQDKWNYLLAGLWPIKFINIKEAKQMGGFNFFHSCWGMQVLVQWRHPDSYSWGSCFYNHWPHSLHRLAA